MAKLTDAEFYEKWQRNIKASTVDIERGVNAVTESPMKKAAGKQDKMRAGILRSIDEGKWARGLNRVSVDDWKNAMVSKGLTRIAAGADGAEAKVKEFAGKLLSHVETGKSKVEKMPDVTLEDSKQRMLAWMDHMTQFKR